MAYSSDVFEMSVAQNTAIYGVFEHHLKKKNVICNVFAAAVAENTAIGKADRQAD